MVNQKGLYVTKLFAKSNLKSKREELGTQEEFVDLLKATGEWNYERSLYRMVEIGERSVEPKVALTIARMLNCNVNDLFESKDKEEQSVA